MTVVLDTSALLAFLDGEPGAARVAARLSGAVVSAVNMAELVTKLVERGRDDDSALMLARGLGLAIHSFDEPQALAAGLLRRRTRRVGLSLGDRACLALAASLGVGAVTADRAWAEAGTGVAVEVIR